MAQRDQRGSDASGGAQSGWRQLDEPGAARTKYQLIALGIFVALGALFVALNSRKVETRFIVFSVVTPLWVGLVVTLAVGVLVGWFLHVWFAHRREGDTPTPRSR
jgi:uncharacterized integral membrane protein